MKKSYIKIIILLLIFSILFILNSFTFKILDQIKLDIVLLLILVLTYVALGFEKDRHRYTKDVILEITIILISFFILYYLFGILIGFAQNANYYTYKSLVNIILPIIIFILIKEVLRYQLLTKASESKKLILLICIFFIIIDNVIPFSIHNININKETFLLISLIFLPSVTENILCTYLSLKFGYKPCIFYLLIINIYKYLAPIIPNPNEYLYSIIFLILPLIIFKKIKQLTETEQTELTLLIKNKSRKKELIIIIPLFLIIVSMIYVVSGYFRYYMVAVASGSMEPKLSKGDVVIIDKKFNKCNKGDIIAYYYEKKIIIHRVYKIIKTDNEYFIYTKGDANNNYDNYKITNDMIVGIVKFKIPLVGYPTVLLNERW